MKCFRISLSLLLLAFSSIGNVACSEDEKKGEEPKKTPPKPIAFLDIANSGDGSIPGGATPKSGKWSVDSGAKKLKLGVEPLVIGWLEFGPEIREKGATMIAAARAPGVGRLQSRMGAGLYGKNGFQIRVVQVTDEVELVRRGAVLTKMLFSTEPGTIYEMELSVIEEGENWRVTGRVWDQETDRPEQPLFSHLAKSEELLFPLAGRPCLVATPFSGEPVAYASAKVYEGAYEALKEAEEEAEEGGEVADEVKALEDEDEGEEGDSDVSEGEDEEEEE